MDTATIPSALKPMRRASRRCIASMGDTPRGTIYKTTRQIKYLMRLTRSLISRRMFTSSLLIATQLLAMAVRSEESGSSGGKMVALLVALR